MSGVGAEKTAEIAANVERFVREVVVPYEKDKRRTSHGPTDELIDELKEKARAAGVLTPHILPDGRHLSQRETAAVLKKSGLSILGPLAVNTTAPDEGNMYLLGKVGSPELKERFLKPLVEGRCRSAFFMTEPADDDGAGSDPSMMKTVCHQDGNHWVINGRKEFITGADGAKVGIVMAKSEDGACMFLVDLPDPAIRIERVLDTIDSSPARRPCRDRHRQSARAGRPDAGGIGRGLPICADPPLARAALALHALARRRQPRQRDRHRLRQSSQGVRQAADRS